MQLMSNFTLRFFSSLILAPLFIYFIYSNDFLLIFLLIAILISTIFELKFLKKITLNKGQEALDLKIEKELLFDFNLVFFKNDMVNFP